LEGQPEGMQKFMRDSSVLREMDPEVCNWLLEIQDSEQKIEYLLNNDLFVTELEFFKLHYHPIFQQFLYRQLDAAQSIALHRRAAAYYQNNNQPNAAIYHYIRGEDYFSAAELLNHYGGQLHAMGHLDTLANFLDLLSPEALSQFPTLVYYMGDLARLHSRFQEALGWYQQAEALWRERGQADGIGRALRGQARIYLDTVNPSKAEELLQEALRLSDRISDRETQSRLYQLLAENKLNLGKVEEAEELRKQAEVLRQEGPDDSQLWYRVLLRTGRLAEARQQLERQALEETSEPVNLPRSHRETQLLLSIIASMQGDGEAALLSSKEGIRRGKELASPFITAVGYMRLGHAYTIQQGWDGYTKAQELFEQVVEISQEISTPRLKVEALWGLTHVYGFQGKLEKARSLAETGVEIATQAGDEWIASLTRLTMGASYVLAEKFDEAASWLEKALRGFQECSDAFGAHATRLWQVYVMFQQEDYEVLIPMLIDVLTYCQQNGHDYLFMRTTLLGMPDERLIVPLLLWAQKNELVRGYPGRLLGEMGLGDIQLHPGYQLRVQTLGGFQVWRGCQPIEHGDWKREKTRQLWQLLVTYRNAPLDREQICEYLWPGTAPEAAGRNFKVALNTLYKVLEPDRVAGNESSYVLREGTIYGLRPGCDVYLDVEQFVSLVRTAENHLAQHDEEKAVEIYKKALDLYTGEYLPDARYQDWSAVEREHLAVLYLQAADSFCAVSLKMGNYQDVISECQRILAQDSCWERAYRHLMSAYDELGDHGQVARTYRRCVDTMTSELNVHPSAETTSLYNDLIEEEKR
jgi:DNA-binding SARP family transcriptional activator